MTDPIKIGDKVRSYDFAGSKQYYVEGTVVAIGPVPFCGADCQHYHIVVERAKSGESILYPGNPGCIKMAYPALNYHNVEVING